MFATGTSEINCRSEVKQFSFQRDSPGERGKHYLEASWPLSQLQIYTVATGSARDGDSMGILSYQPTEAPKLLSNKGCPESLNPKPLNP